MSKTNNTNNKLTELLKGLLVCSSVLGAAGHFLNNENFFVVFGILCGILVLGLSLFALMSTPRAFFPLFLLYVIIFSLEVVVSFLITETVPDAILLGICFIGASLVILARLLDWSHAYMLRHGPEWIDGGRGPDASDTDDDWDEMKPILLDETLPTEERIASMSLAFDRMDTAFSTVSENVDIIRHNEKTMKALERYMDSGLWQQDFEAMERGEVNPECDLFGVLSEDGLYNLLESSKDILIEPKEKKQESDN